MPYSAVPRAPYTPRSSGYAPRPNATSNNAGGSNYPSAGNASGFICFNCRQLGHYAKECPQKSAAEKAQPPKKNDKYLGTGKRCLNHISAEEAREDPSVIMGTLRINQIPAKVLFDSGASHSFL